MSTCHVPGWRHTSEPWTPAHLIVPHSPSSPKEMEMRHATSLCPWLHSASARLLHLFPILMWSAVICFGSQSPRTVSFIWRAGPAPQRRQQLCTQQSRVCLVCPGGHEYPPDPAPHRRGTCLLASLIWEDNKLNKGADDHGGLFAVCMVYI